MNYSTGVTGNRAAMPSVSCDQAFNLPAYQSSNWPNLIAFISSPLLAISIDTKIDDTLVTAK